MEEVVALNDKQGARTLSFWMFKKKVHDKRVIRVFDTISGVDKARALHAEENRACAQMILIEVNFE